MDELEEWRARPTRENRLALGAEIAALPRPFVEPHAEVALEWAIGLPVAGGGALWDRDPLNLALTFLIRGAHSTRRGLPCFAAEAVDTALRIGRGRAVDRVLRILLAESTNDTDPCFWAAVAIAFRLPKYAKFHGWPTRVQRRLEGAVESAPEETDLAELAVQDESQPLGSLVEGRPPLGQWDDLDLPFVPCDECQKTSASPTLCDACVAARAEIALKNVGDFYDEDVARPVVDDVWRRFPAVLNELSAKKPDEITALLRDKLRELRIDGGVWQENESHRTLRGPSKS